MKKFSRELVTGSAGSRQSIMLTNGFILTSEHLAGKISHLTLEQLAMICEEQMRQDNPCDPEVFQNYPSAGIGQGGFTWSHSGNEWLFEELLSDL